MTVQHKRLLEALSASIHSEKIHWLEPLSDEEWTSLFHLAEEQKILPLIYDAVYGCPSANREMMQVYRSIVRRQVMLQVVKTAEFQLLYTQLSDAGIRPLVVKGLICRALYPNPDARLSSDEDMLIPWEDFTSAHTAMLDYGMHLLDEDQTIEKDYEVPYGKQGSPLHIELHKSLFPPEQDVYGEWNAFFPDIHQTAQKQMIQGTVFWTPDCTHHLLYLLLHALKHFLHSGFGLRQICDIALFARNYDRQIDWEQILHSCEAIHAELFAAAVFKIGSVHLGIPSPKCLQDRSVDELPLLEDVLQAGIYGSAERSRLHSSNMTLHAVAAQKKGRTQHAVLQTVFPSVHALKDRYPYLEKHPLLLPVAWADRLRKYRRETKSSAHNKAAQSLKIGHQRIQLLKQYRIIP